VEQVPNIGSITFPHCGEGINAVRDQSSRSIRLIFGGLIAVLVFLPAFALWGAFSTFQAGTQAKHASGLANAFEEARYAVGAEESLERKYRLEPSGAVRRLHSAVAETLIASLDRARSLGAPADQVLVQEVLARHGLYLAAVERMFAAIDAGDLDVVISIDNIEADPAFAEVERLVSAAAIDHNAQAEMFLGRLANVQRGVLIATPVVFAIGMGLIILSWIALRGYRRQTVDALTRETAQVRRSEQRFRALVQNASDVVLICTAGGTISYQSRTAETAWGFSPKGMLYKSLADMIHPDDQPALRDLWEQLQAAPGTTRITELRLRDAAEVWHHVSLILTNLLQETAVDGIVVTARDIGERKAFESQLTQQAFYDSLTLLPNRALFLDRLEQAVTRAGRRHDGVGILYLDLDNFKTINDSLGHQAGDRLLIGAAGRLQACVRGEDTVARLGGDEFVILLGYPSNEADALLVAGRIAQEFSRPFVINGREFAVTASVGVALSDTGQEGADNLMRNADVAMYRAKTEGKARCVVFAASMHLDALARLDLQNDLRKAIERGELRVHYQPIVLLDSGHIVEVEALVRWQHPTRGLLAPAEFIPVAEETGLIVPLGQWVLEEACRQVAVWQTLFPADPPLAVSVNLSSCQFQHPGLIEDIKHALRLAGLAPTNLKLEITESVIMRDVEVTIAKLHQLKHLGIQLAIDDFGTGYSSLAYLKLLPLDVLKIDRSFVQGIGRDREDTAIVRAVLSLAKSLNLTVTGEGIETAEQSALLRTWECERGQGYYFAKPQDAPAVTKLLSAASHPEDHPKAA
jgi:diguanylate cyclase (GGDEF)-like protein/PAS domain S-box-containing protein